MQGIKAGKICRIAGWGPTIPILNIKEAKKPMKTSERLQETEVTLWDIKKCDQTYEKARLDKDLEVLIRRFEVNEETNICASGKKDKKPFVSGACFVSLQHRSN